MKGAIEPELQRLPFDKVLFLSAFDSDTEKSEGGFCGCVPRKYFTPQSLPCSRTHIFDNSPAQQRPPSRPISQPTSTFVSKAL
jgi:hypothetical protein